MERLAKYQSLLSWADSLPTLGGRYRDGGFGGGRGGGGRGRRAAMEESDLVGDMPSAAFNLLKMPEKKPTGGGVGGGGREEV